tara:strand:- start:1492 stop:1719 length:228 start_codon:yes stop_codon:yes gene_type:complete
MYDIDRLINIGRALEKISEILDRDIFDKLSKHDMIWEPKTIEECYDFLDDLRCTISAINDDLSAAYFLIKKNDEE